MEKQTSLQVGSQAPALSLIGDDEKIHHLTDFLGKKVILYFYPKDDTPGCTQEACDFRDHLPAFQEKGAVIIGVSPDNILSHQQFKKKYQIPFLLLSDPEKATAKQFGAYGQKNMYGKISEGLIRSTFLIDEKGIIQKIYAKVTVAGHVTKLMDSLL